MKEDKNTDSKAESTTPLFVDLAVDKDMMFYSPPAQYVRAIRTHGGTKAPDCERAY